MDMNRKNHTGHGLRWMEALAREQIASNKNAEPADKHPAMQAVTNYVATATKHGMPLEQAKVVTANIQNAIELGFMSDIVERSESEPAYFGVNFCPNCGQRAPENLHEYDGYTYCGSCDPDDASQ